MIFWESHLEKLIWKHEIFKIQVFPGFELQFQVFDTFWTNFRHFPMTKFQVVKVFQVGWEPVLRQFNIKGCFYLKVPQLRVDNWPQRTSVCCLCVVIRRVAEWSCMGSCSRRFYREAAGSSGKSWYHNDLWNKHNKGFNYTENLI